MSTQALFRSKNNLGEGRAPGARPLQWTGPPLGGFPQLYWPERLDQLGLVDPPGLGRQGSSLQVHPQPHVRQHPPRHIQPPPSNLLLLLLPKQPCRPHPMMLGNGSAIRRSRAWQGWTQGLGASRESDSLARPLLWACPPFLISQASVSTAPPILDLGAWSQPHGVPGWPLTPYFLGKSGDREGPAGKKTGVCRSSLCTSLGSWARDVWWTLC